MINSSKKPKSDFSNSLLKWFAQHGRKSLPWQQTRNPYHIWVSEIMLQQTQVETVIPYYQKFMACFPSIENLANAEQEEVLTHWAGLGYYARARNLHRAAQQIRDKFNCRFPDNFDDVVELPGIGRSTAGAILAFSSNQSHPILDGNVKRVLTRYFAISGYPGTKSVGNQLWDLAEQLTPVERVADYTQAIMDLGATLCTRTRPNCASCPISPKCQGFQQGTPTAYPTPKPKAHRPRKRSRMILIRNSRSECLLVKRPPAGIWGGLWVLPELIEPSEKIQDWCNKEFGIVVTPGENLKIVPHGFTHFELEIQPVICRVEQVSNGIMDGERYLWYNPQSSKPIAIPAAIRKIFSQLDRVLVP